MKKKGFQLSLVILMLLCTNLNAQKVTFGLKGGMSIPNLTTGGSQTPLNAGYSSNFRGCGGIYGEYHLTKKFSVSVGAAYSTQGGVMERFETLLNDELPSVTLYSDYKYESKLDYLVVPVLARFNWQKKRSRLKWYAAFGPFAGYLIKASNVRSYRANYMDKEYSDLFSETYSYEKTDMKDELYTFNVGLELLAGISYNLSKKHALFIEGGGNYGFLSITRAADNTRNYSGAATVSLGYAYTFQKQRRGWGR